MPLWPLIHTLTLATQLMTLPLPTLLPALTYPGTGETKALGETSHPPTPAHIPYPPYRTGTGRTHKPKQLQRSCTSSLCKQNTSVVTAASQSQNTNGHQMLSIKEILHQNPSAVDTMRGHVRAPPGKGIPSHTGLHSPITQRGRYQYRKLTETNGN